MSYWVLDASVWAARLVSQDVFYATVKTWMEARRSEGAILLSPSLLLAEVAGAISRRTGEADLAKWALESLQNLPGLRLVEMDQVLAKAAAQQAASLGLRGADSFYVAVAVQLKLPLATLDKDQYERARRVVEVHMISEDSS